jgi:hypothetical protein
VLDALDENWRAIDRVLRCGSCGLPAGLSLHRLPLFLEWEDLVQKRAQVLEIAETETI